MSTYKSSTPTRRPTYEKVEAIRRVLAGQSKASVARSMNVPESTLRGWCKSYKLRSYIKEEEGPLDYTKKHLDSFNAAPSTNSTELTEGQRHLQYLWMQHYMHQMRYQRLVQQLPMPSEVFVQPRINGSDFFEDERYPMNLCIVEGSAGGSAGSVSDESEEARMSS